MLMSLQLFLLILVAKLQFTDPLLLINSCKPVQLEHKRNGIAEQIKNKDDNCGTKSDSFPHISPNYRKRIMVSVYFFQLNCTY